jgi:transcriptional regulator with XRE-family HTH domain
MDKPIAAIFGAVLRSRREAAGISQEELADRAGLHRTYVSLIERGKRTASIEVVRRVSAALDMSMAELIDATEKHRG